MSRSLVPSYPRSIKNKKRSRYQDVVSLQAIKNLLCPKWSLRSDFNTGPIYSNGNEQNFSDQIFCLSTDIDNFFAKGYDILANNFLVGLGYTNSTIPVGTIPTGTGVDTNSINPGVNSTQQALRKFALACNSLQIEVLYYNPSNVVANCTLIEYAPVQDTNQSLISCWENQLTADVSFIGASQAATLGTAVTSGYTLGISGYTSNSTVGCSFYGFIDNGVLWCLTSSSNSAINANHGLTNQVTCVTGNPAVGIFSGAKVYTGSFPAELGVYVTDQPYEGSSGYGSQATTSYPVQFNCQAFGGFNGTTSYAAGNQYFYPINVGTQGDDAQNGTSSVPEVGVGGKPFDYTNGTVSSSGAYVVRPQLITIYPSNIPIQTNAGTRTVATGSGSTQNSYWTASISNNLHTGYVDLKYRVGKRPNFSKPEVSAFYKYIREVNVSIKPGCEYRHVIDITPFYITNRTYAVMANKNAFRSRGLLTLFHGTTGTVTGSSAIACNPAKLNTRTFYRGSFRAIPSTNEETVVYAGVGLDSTQTSANYVVSNMETFNPASGTFVETVNT